MSFFKISMYSIMFLKVNILNCGGFYERRNVNI